LISPLRNLPFGAVWQQRPDHKFASAVAKLGLDKQIWEMAGQTQVIYLRIW